VVQKIQQNSVTCTWTSEQIKYLKLKGLYKESNTGSNFDSCYTSFFRLDNQYKLSLAFCEKYLKCHTSDIEITIKALIHNHKNYKKTFVTFTNTKALFMEEEQKHNLSVYELYCGKLIKLLTEFNETADTLRICFNNNNIKIIKENINTLVKYLTNILDLNILIKISNKKFQSGIIPLYLYNHYISDNYKPSKCSETMLLKQSFETGKKEFLLNCMHTMAPFKIVRSACINKENMIEYKIALVPKDAVISLTPFEKPITNNQNHQKNKHKPKNKRSKK
jgi:hypothetical protein